MNCSLCQSALPAGDAVVCEKCDLYHINRYTWNSLDDFLAFLGGKKFIYHRLSIGTYGVENARLREFSNAIVISPDVIELKLAEFNNPEELIYVADLMEKLPNCSGIQLAQFTITENTAPYLSKLMAFPQLRALPVQSVTFTPEACQVFAESMDPARFSILSLEECDIPNACPLLNALVTADLTTIPSFLDRPMTDEECTAMSNLIKHNTRIKTVAFSKLSNKQSRELAEALKDFHHVQRVFFRDSDLVTAMPTIAELLCTSNSISYCSISSVSMTLGLLTELCDGLKDRKSTADLTLHIHDRNYNDSLEPIVKLLEHNVNLPGLSIATSSNAQEWISVYEALKKNTTLKELDTSFIQIQGVDQVVGAITDSLTVNNTLQSLFVDTYLDVPVLDPLVKVVLSRNKLKKFHISHGTFQELDTAKLCEMLKSNWKLKEFSSGYETSLTNDAPQNVKMFQEMMEQNNSLVLCDIINNAYEHIQPYKERNEKHYEHWTETKQDILVIIHNLARNAETIRKLLPIDMWLEVFKRLRYPLMPNNGFENVAKKIFKQYQLY